MQVVTQDIPGPGPDMGLLIRRAADGDETAFEALYRRHVGLVYATCLRISGRPALAEELTQETFVRAWRGLRSLQGAEGFTPWVARIAINVSLDAVRSMGRSTAREEVLDDSWMAAAEPAENPGTARIDLERAIAGLPAGARTVFVLFDIHGWAHGEIAKALGVAEATSKTQLHRARQLLREALRS